MAEWAEKKHARARWLAIPSFAALLALAVLAQRQLHYWSDNVTLWSHALRVTKQNFVAEDNLGGALIVLGKFDEAMPHFEAAGQINPWDPVGNLNLATHEQQAGNLSQAVELYLKVVRMTPDDTLRANAFSNLGAAYRSLGDPERAEASYAAALRLAPSNAHACIGLGLLALKAGDYSSAAGLFSRAIAVQPTDVGYLLLAQALRQGGFPVKLRRRISRRNGFRQI